MRKHANKFKKQLKHEENLPTVRSLWSTTHSLKDSSLVLDSAIAQRKIETWIHREREQGNGLVFQQFPICMWEREEKAKLYQPITSWHLEWQKAWSYTSTSSMYSVFKSPHPVITIELSKKINIEINWSTRCS